jgi:VWFA-related protein
MRRIPFAVLLALLLAFPAGGLGAPAPAPAPAAAAAAAAGAGGKAFSETTQVTAVEVPVQVVRDGEPVRGLTAADFEIFEGRKQQAITGFDVVDLAAPESQRLSASIPAAGRRHFLLIFDLTNSDPKHVMRARTAVAQSLLKTLNPADLVGMATYGANSGLKLVLGFTSDRRQILKAIDSLGLADLTDRMHHDPMLLTMSALADAAGASQGQDTAPPDGVSGVRGVARAAAGQALASAMFQSTLMAVARESMANQRANLSAISEQVRALTQSFAELARTMSAVSGRKLVVYFSEGFDSTILQGVDDIGEQQAISNTTMHGLGAFTESDERFGSTRQNNRVEAMLEAFRRSGCVIESVDIGGLRGDQDLDLGEKRASGEAALFQMAHDTGGELFRNFNDLSDAMARLARSTSLTYVLTFQPEGPLAAGSYHAIKVKLKNPPRGAQVTFRPGYYAPRPFTQERPLEKMLAASDQLMSGNAGGSIATAVLAAPFRTGPDQRKAYVPVIIEADGATLLAGGAGKTVPAEIYAYAVDAQGSIFDFFDQNLRLDVEKAGPALRQGGLKFFGHLELPAGEYSVRVLLRNGETGAFGKRAVVVTVPAFAGEEPVLLSPFFPEASGRWTVVRESPRGEQRDASYPFTVGAQAYVPAALPRLQPGEAVPVALVGYNLGGGQLEAKARVQGADGRDLGGGDLRLAGSEPGGGTRPEVWRAVFRAPRGLAPGQYRLIVTVTGPGGAQTGTSLFSVPAAAPAG